ncbi:class F sortase [Tessaracoccus terricola]
MTAPRRALPQAPSSRAARLYSWLTTAWQPAALACAVCLLAAGLWPIPEVPPGSPAELRPLVSIEAATQSSRADAAPPPVTSPTGMVAPVVTSAAPEPEQQQPDGPRLRLAALGISAPLQEVGVEGSELEIPADPTRVGMWRGGARPGDDAGTVLVSGHVSWDGRRGALWELAAATPGQEVQLVTPAGSTSTWRVTAVERLRRDADHPELFTTSGPHRLVVVTCGGPVVDGHYRDLVAVVAVPA